MKYILCLALTCIAGQLALAAPSGDPSVNCSNFYDVLDDLGSASHFTTINDKYINPTTEEEYIKKCKLFKDSTKTMRKYNGECQSQLTQQILSAVLRTRSNYFDNICNQAKPEFKELFEAAACIQRNVEKIKPVERKNVLLFQIIHDMNIPDEKQRIRQACCNIIEAKRLFVEGAKENCSKYESRYSDYFDSYTSEALGLICPATDALECNKLEATKFEGVELKTKSFLTPLVKLVKTLDH